MSDLTPEQLMKWLRGLVATDIHMKTDPTCLKLAAIADLIESLQKRVEELEDIIASEQVAQHGEVVGKGWLWRRKGGQPGETFHWGEAPPDKFRDDWYATEVLLVVPGGEGE